MDALGAHMVKMSGVGRSVNESISQSPQSLNYAYDSARLDTLLART